MTRTALIALGLITLNPAVLAQEVSAPAGLPGELQALLEAAANAPSPEAFVRAVEVLALTQDEALIVAGAAIISAERAGHAREVLGLSAPAADALASDNGPQDTSASAANGEVHAPVWQSAPTQLARSLVQGESEIWSGEARLGLRYDSGNSDRQDYVLGLKAERALSVWGLEASLDYAYSEVDGTIGRDEIRAFAQMNREAGERWTLYANGEYRDDALSGLDFAALLGAGAGYRLFDRDDLNWSLEAGPGMRILQPVGGDTAYEGVLDLGSDVQFLFSEAVTFTSSTSALLGERARAEQVFALDTALNALWSLRLSYQYTYEFEPEPGFENADTRTDVSVIRKF